MLVQNEQSKRSRVHVRTRLVPERADQHRSANEQRTNQQIQAQIDPLRRVRPARRIRYRRQPP